MRGKEGNGSRERGIYRGEFLEEGARGFVIPRRSGFRRRRRDLAWGGRRRRARAIGQWGPAVSGTRAREREERATEGEGLRATVLVGPRLEWLAGWGGWLLGRLAWLALVFFVFNRKTKVKRTKIIKTIYRHNIYKNVQKNNS